MRYPLFDSFVLILFCICVGCDGTATKEPKEAASGETAALIENVNGLEDGNATSKESKAKSTPTNHDTASTKTENKPPKNTNLGQPEKTNGRDAKLVNHEDPTSYPITVLPDKEPGDIMMLSWNVESNGAEGDTICSELTELNNDDRYDVVVLTEVLPENLKKFRIALGMHYKYAYSKSGRNDRMQILYNEKRFAKVRHFEITEINYLNRYRAPLVLHLSERKTVERPNEIQFMVMANHLARGKAEIRQKQANDLVEWARKQTLPTVALGDYNFDYVFETEKGNPALANFMKDNIWRWVMPAQMVDTNWYDDPQAPDGKDDFPGSMLDFAFVAGPAKDWVAKCNVIVRKDDFPDNEKTSDHRPFELILKTFRK